MHALDPHAVPEENWEGNPFRNLLPAEIGQGVEIYLLTVTGPNPHHHDSYDQVYLIQSGRGLMQIGDEQQEVGPGWLIFIPRGQRHSLAPLGDEPVVLHSIIHHQP